MEDSFTHRALVKAMKCGLISTDVMIIIIIGHIIILAASKHNNYIPIIC